MARARAFPNRNTARGERSGKSVLTAEQVLKMRHAYRMRDVTYMDLSIWYNVSTGTVSAILLHQTWKHLDCDCCLPRCTYWENKV
jgi:hypothetical protein